MSALSDARTAVEAALAGIGVPVHVVPPGALRAPCVVLEAGSPWIEPRGHVHLELVAYASPAGGNLSALDRLENLIEAIRNALWAAGLAPGDTAQPVAESDNGSLSASTSVIVRTTCK